MYCKFPYFKGRPHIPLTIESTHERKRFLPVLDSGADFSVFYKSDALRLGLNWEEGESIQLLNADETVFWAKQFLLTVNIEGHQIPTKISFVDSNKTGTPLLGRHNVFKQFKILINEKEEFVEFQSH